MVCYDRATVFWIGHADSTRRRCRSTEVLLAYSRSVRQRMRDDVIWDNQPPKYRSCKKKIKSESSDTVNPRLSKHSDRHTQTGHFGQNNGLDLGWKATEADTTNLVQMREKKSLTDQNKDPKKHCPSSVLHVTELTAQIIH